MKLLISLCIVGILTPVAVLNAGVPAPAVSLKESVRPSPIKDVVTGTVEILGSVTGPDRPVSIRVTTSLGGSYLTRVTAKDGKLACKFPQDFAGAPELKPLLLYVDATDEAQFDGAQMLQHQAEILLIVSGTSSDTLPDLPVVFADDFVDADGNKDQSSKQWPMNRTLANLCLNGRGARLAGYGRPEFDLQKPDDWNWFKNNATLYDFDNRDRDWKNPLGHRVAAGFWKAVWTNWFNPSNDHPWDGNPGNRDQSNYRPYTFTNDLADMLVLYQMRRRLPPAVEDNRNELSRDVLENLLALQHQGPGNFALKEKSGKQENYTTGAFHYGMFTTGEWLTEGQGWFANPEFSDFRFGGVFNGRAVWALGESLKADPKGPTAPAIRKAIPLAVKFCLQDAVQYGYARRIKNNAVFWRDAGEHGYLLLGLLAACEVVPDLPVAFGPGRPTKTLSAVCADALDAFEATVKGPGVWTEYPDQDAMAIAALATVRQTVGTGAQRARWLAAAKKVADNWLAAHSDPSERKEPTPHFGFRKGNGMTHFMGDDHRVRFTFYVDGHWLHALAKLHARTGEPRYRDRCRQLLGYLCGDNPFHTRIFNELGAVYNFVTDNDGDGIEDHMQQDLYPESTAFVQIGLLHYLRNKDR